VINSLYTNMHSSLIQIGSRPCMVRIVWCVVDTTLTLYYIILTYIILNETCRILHYWYSYCGLFTCSIF